MKIKVDKKEWESLLQRVSDLEDDQIIDLNYRKNLESRLKEMMENYFKGKVQTYMIKRDKDMIVAEVRGEVMNNIFKEIK